MSLHSSKCVLTISSPLRDCLSYFSHVVGPLIGITRILSSLVTRHSPRSILSSATSTSSTLIFMLAVSVPHNMAGRTAAGVWYFPLIFSMLLSSSFTLSVYYGGLLPSYFPLRLLQSPNTFFFFLMIILTPARLMLSLSSSAAVHMHSVLIVIIFKPVL